MTAELRPWRPTREQILAAGGRTVDDIAAPGLRVLFCGINPGLYTAAIGHHFGRPGNRFWKVLALAGFTERQLSPFEERLLLESGVGVTNLVARATASASELRAAELRAGADRLERKVGRLRPHSLAVVGMQAYRSGFGRPRARIGRQPEAIGTTAVWVLPNPSGLQAHYQLPDLVAAFAELRQSLPEPAARGSLRLG